MLNIPAFAFYYSGNESQADKDVATAPSVQEYFAYFSLGNIGQDQNACGESNLAVKAMENNMKIACSYGHLSTLVAYGVSKNDDFSCADMEESKSIEN